MGYYSDSTYTSLKANPSTVMNSLYNNHGSGFKTDCQRGEHATGTITPSSPFATMTTEQTKMAQAALCAFDSIPYGDDGGNEWTLSAICGASAISCQQACKFALELYNTISSYASNSKKNLGSTSGIYNGTLTANGSYDSSKPIVTVIGWNGGNIGNHAQILFYDPANTTYPWMLIDPTYGLFTMGTTLDSMCNGTVISTNNMVSFFEAYNPKSNISSSQTNNTSVVKNGTCKTSDQLYSFHGLANLTLTTFGAFLAWQAWLE